MTKRKVDEAATKAKHNVDQSTTNDTVINQLKLEFQLYLIFNQRQYKNL